MPPPYFLFVYGSLRRGFRNAAYEYISRFFELVGDARVKGDLYDMGDYPAAVPGEGRHYLMGELYRIRNEHELSWAMAQLDDYEGVKTEQGEHPEFRRDITEAECQGRKEIAWIYWYNSPVSGHPLIPSGDVLKYMQDKKQL